MMKQRNMLKTAAVTLLFSLTLQAASIQEPSTVFYGKVIGTGDAQPFMIHEGSLVWTIRNANGSNVVFHATLFPLKNGEFSYRLDIPHSAVAYELEPPDFGIPLPVVCQTNNHISALVNGLSAEFIGPAGSSFTAGQMMRAQTYRLDMAVNVNALDSDGDGMPDWWEDMMGLDKQNASDVYIDSDGDGVLSRAEYRNSTDPNHDDRIPSLSTEELLVFSESVTGIRLTVTDINSTTDELHFTLTQLPVNGQLVLRNVNENSDDPDQELTVGAQFTQADVNAGRLVFMHDADDAITADAFELTVSDGVSPESDSGTVKLTFYREPENLALMSTAQQQRYRAYTAAQRSDIVIWDAVRSFENITFAAPSSGMELTDYTENYLPKFGTEQRQVMTGGRGDDQISGGMADDIITGGIGADILIGGGGADTFVFDTGDDASDIISDFNPLEGDRVNLSGLLVKRSGMVHDSVRFQISGADTLIGLNVDEGDTDFTSQVLKLTGVTLDALDGYELVLSGAFAVGRLKLQSCISIAATDDEASENGSNSGVFTFTRQGDLAQAVDVNILISGSAQNGSDYSTITPVVHFEAGESLVTVEVVPFVDGNIEQDEIVEITLQDAETYRLGRDVLANLTIKDLQSVVGIEVLQATGAVNPTIPAAFLVKRDGQTANGLFVRLKIGGKARNGVDYQYVYNYVNFAAGQSAVAVQVLPREYAVLSGGAETVSLEVVEDSAYALADIAIGSVVLVDRLDTLADWKARVAPDSPLPLSEFALHAAANTGIDYLRCYAFGIDPENIDRTLLPQINFRNGYFNVDIRQNPSATDVQFVVEASTDLHNWSGGLIRRVSVPELAEEAGVVSYEAIPAVGLNSKLFIRVRVIYDD